MACRLPDDFKKHYIVEQPLVFRATHAEGSWDGLRSTPLMDVPHIVTCWSMLRELYADQERPEPAHGKIKHTWNRRWLPIMNFESRKHLCLDLDPGPTGVRGQIIEFWTDSSARVLVVNSLQELIGLPGDA